jgi:hypothetical protein
MYAWGFFIYLAMPILRNNIICVSTDELKEIGVSENTIKHGCMRQRKGLVNCWPHHKEG